MSGRQTRLHLEHIPDLDPGFRQMLEQCLLRSEDGDLDLRWALAFRLELLEEVVCESLPTAPGKSGPEETSAQTELPVERRGWKAQDERLEELMREEVRSWWKGFSAREELRDLYRRAALQKTKTGSTNSRRPLDHSDGLPVAQAMLADIPATSPLDREWEYAALSTVLADVLLPPEGVPSRAVLTPIIKRASTHRVCFDALSRVCEALESRGTPITGPLAKLRPSLASRRRTRPPMKRIRRGRPATLTKVPRDIQIQFTVAVLERVGFPPQGSYLSVSGCRIVAEASGLCEDTVIGVWKQRTWGTSQRSFVPVREKYARALGERTGARTSEG